MNLLVDPKTNNRGEHLDTLSEYKPSTEVKNRFTQILSDMNIAEDIMNNPYEEFGSGSEGDSMDIISFTNKMQKRFNNNIPSATDDPNQQWRANTIRPLTRNKVISIVAHLTQSVLYPNVIAQNDDSEEDKDMALIMRDIIEWAGEQSKYEDTFISAVMDMCVNPAVILFEDYSRVSRNIKDIKEDGSWDIEEVVDELYSGFQNSIVPIDELYIGNIYEPELQKQPFLIWRKVISYSDAKAKYGNNENFKKYVTPGLRIFYNGDEQTFYEQYDEQLEERLVEEINYYNRGADLHLRIVNGVLLDDPDRPIQRKDKRYPFAKSFYEQFNSRFFYGMPLVAKIMPDQDVIDTLYNLLIDGTILETMPPSAIYGVEEMDSAVMIPGGQTSFKNPESRIDSIGTGRNLSAAANTLEKVEGSADESSNDPLSSGQQTGGDKTKYEVVRLEQNAKTVLGLAGKMIIQLIRDFGILRVGSIVQFVPIAEVKEIIGDDVKLKFPRILLPNKNVEGKTKSRQIEFTQDMPESEEEQKEIEFDMLEQEVFDVRTGDEGDKSIAKVNPSVFRRMKYLIKMEPDFLDSATKFFKKLQLYDRAIANPLSNMEAVTRDFLYGAYVPGKEDKYLKKPVDAAKVTEANEILNTKPPTGADTIPKQDQI